MSFRDPFDNIDKLLGRAFDDAPRELKATVSLARGTIRRRELVDAHNKLKEAQNLLDSNGEELADWRAEVAATGALYYLAGGPEPEPNTMWRKVAEAQRLEPDNELLKEIIDIIEKLRTQR
jgi:hypothetical protein